MLKVQRMTDTARLPTKATEGATAYDVYSDEDYTMDLFEIRAIKTGLRFDMSRLPKNVEMQIRSRSGMALRDNVTVLNSPGTIDRDYTGELRVILINFGDNKFIIKKGLRIAQMVFGMYQPNMTMFPVEEILVKSDRGEGGFGSTGA